MVTAIDNGRSWISMSVRDGPLMIVGGARAKWEKKNLTGYFSEKKKLPIAAPRKKKSVHSSWRK